MAKQILISEDAMKTGLEKLIVEVENATIEGFAARIIAYNNQVIENINNDNSDDDPSERRACVKTREDVNAFIKGLLNEEVIDLR